MSVVSMHMIFVTLFTFILLANGNPVDSSEKYEIVVCPENGCECIDVLNILNFPFPSISLMNPKISVSFSA